MLLTFILCSRNDSYMGNPLARLETVLNSVAQNVVDLHLQEEVEIIVTDWGSDKPLREALELTPAARKMTGFVEIPKPLVARSQKDTPFAEVLALNAAAKASRGAYIGRIDQDTLVGKRFLRDFKAWTSGAKNPGFKVETAVMFSQRRQIPFRFATECPSVEQITTYLNACGGALLVERVPPLYFYSPVGIFLIHRDLWWEAGGYDERLLYWGWMEVDFIYRLWKKYPLVNIGPIVGHDFFHLEHYDPRTPRKTPRKLNPMNTTPAEFSPNPPNWGFADEGLQVARDLTTEERRGTRHAPFRTSDGSVRKAIVAAWASWCARPLVVAPDFARRAFRGLQHPEKYRGYWLRLRNRLGGKHSLSRKAAGQEQPGA